MQNMQKKILILVRRLSNDDTDKSICCCIRLDNSIPTFYLPRSLVQVEGHGVEAIVRMPIWLAKRCKIDHLAMDDNEAIT